VTAKTQGRFAPTARWLTLLAIGPAGALLGCSVLAATYHVDYGGGNDSLDGLSQSSAWKHAPGDPAASGVASSTVLRPGDVVMFKGGVAYRGRIVLTRSGTSGSRITYKGDGWGSGKAVIEGADPFAPAWTGCPTAAACGGNPNFANIHYTNAPAGYSSFLTALYENTELLWYAQSPNPRDPFYHDEISDFHPVPYPNGSVVQNQGSVTDPSVLNQTSATFWNGASVAGWITGNTVEIQPVTRFDPASRTLYHQSFSAAPYKDRTGRYALLNHVSLIDRAGEYAFEPATGRIYLWPRSGGNPAINQYSVYARETAFLADAAVSQVTIEGFHIRNFTYGFQLSNTSASSITIRNNEVTNLRSHNKYAIFLNARDSVVEGNRIVNANRAVGILSSADNITVQRNHVERASRQGIWFMGARNSRIVNNTVIDIGGSHSNGISIYSGSTNIQVSGNKLVRVNSPITFEASSDLTFSNNVVTPGGQISDWFGMSGTVAFYNNTFAGSNFYLASSPSYVFKNNVLQSAPAKGVRSHNLFTASQSSLQTGERVETNLSLLFVNASAGDLRLRSGSSAIEAGTSVPVTTDIDGLARPQGGAWDIGAYEFSLSSPPLLPLPPPTNLRVQ
jgi:hypothetical protein